MKKLRTMSPEDWQKARGLSVREAAVTFRDKYSASAIGEAKRVSRNAIIGYWFRHRRSLARAA